MGVGENERGGAEWEVGGILWHNKSGGKASEAL
jgi:hypothetical protein